MLPIAPHEGFRVDKNGRIIRYFSTPPIENLVLEGGGPRGLVYTGALPVLEKEGVLKGLKRVAGSSAGALTAVMVALGYKSDEIQRFAEQANLSVLQDLNRNSKLAKLQRAVSNLLSPEQGVYEGQVLLGVVRVLIRDKVEEVINSILATISDRESRDMMLAQLMSIGLVKEIKNNKPILNESITFRHIHYLANQYPKSGFKEVFLTGTNYTQNRLEVFSNETEPDMEVALGVRISMSIPWMYKMVPYKSQHYNQQSYYMDGGCLKNFPMDIFDNEKYKPNGNIDYKGIGGQNLCTLGLKVDTQTEMSKVLWGEKVKKEGFFTKLWHGFRDKILKPLIIKPIITPIKNYITNWLIGVNVSRASIVGASQTKELYSQRTIQISDEDYTLTKFKLNEIDKKTLRKSGELAAQHWINLHHGELMYQRYQSLSELPVDKLKEFRDFLNKTPARDVFYMPEKSDIEIEQVRLDMLKTINKLLPMAKPDCQAVTRPTSATVHQFTCLRSAPRNIGVATTVGCRQHLSKNFSASDSD